MPKVTYIQFDGTVSTVDVPCGMSVMEGAVSNNVAGIEAECGGACSCATCHVYVDPAWATTTGTPQPHEQDMLLAALDVEETSRLSCQIKVCEELDGLIVRLPELQI